MSQLSYSRLQAQVAYEGQKADAGFDDVITAIAEGAVPFGKLVVRGTDADKQGKLPGASADVTTVTSVLGIALHAHDREQDSSVAADYKDKEAMSVLRQGRCWVKVEEAVTVGSTVHVRYAAGGNGVGAFGDTTGTSERAPLARARYMTDAAANGFALIEVKL